MTTWTLANMVTCRTATRVITKWVDLDINHTLVPNIGSKWTRYLLMIDHKIKLCHCHRLDPLPFFGHHLDSKSTTIILFTIVLCKVCCHYFVQYIFSNYYNCKTTWRNYIKSIILNNFMVQDILIHLLIHLIFVTYLHVWL